MSQGLDLASDDDDNDIRPRNGLAIPNYSTERRPPDSQVNDDTGTSSAGLNPWSIAMMAAPRRSNEAHEAQKHIGRTPLPSARPSNRAEEPPVIRTHEPARARANELRFPACESVPIRREFPWDYPESIAEDTRRPEAAPMVLRRSAPHTTRSSASGGSRVPGGPYRRPTQATISSSFNKAQRRPLVRAHAFVPQRPSSLGSAPGTISHGPRSLPNQNNQERNVHRRMASSHESAANRRGAIERYLQSVEQIPDVAAILHPSRDVRPTGAPGDVPTEDDNEVIEVPSEEISGTSLAAEDTRAYLIRRQRSMVAEPEKRLRRMRTDLLPFERIPPSFRTKELALKMNVSPEKVSKQLFSGATQPDPFQTGAGTQITQMQNLLDDEMGLQLVERRTAAFLARRGGDGIMVALKPVLSESEV